MQDGTHNPYAAPAAQVGTAAMLVDGSELADRMTRLGAVLIDALIGLAISIPVMYMSGFWPRAMAQQVGGLELALWAVGGFLGFVAIHAHPLHQSGQTWGKRALGIRIVDLEGGKPDLLRLFGLRYGSMHFGGQVPIVGPIFGIVNALMIFRADRRCLHDLIAGTRVVKVPQKPPA